MMQDTILLIEKSKKYIHSAEYLMKIDDFDSAVSRAYYSAFYMVEALLLVHNMTFSSHKSVISAFDREFIKTDIFDKDMSKILHKSFEKRQIGDYSYTTDLTYDDVKILINQVKEFNMTIEDYINNTITKE